MKKTSDQLDLLIRITKQAWESLGFSSREGLFHWLFPSLSPCFLISFLSAFIVLFVCFCFYVYWVTIGFPGGSVVKNLPVKVQEIQVWSLGQEDPLEEEIAAHPSFLAWEVPWTEVPIAPWVARSRMRLSSWAVPTAPPPAEGKDCTGQT